MELAPKKYNISKHVFGLLTMLAPCRTIGISVSCQKIEKNKYFKFRFLTNRVSDQILN